MKETKKKETIMIANSGAKQLRKTLENDDD